MYVGDYYVQLQYLPREEGGGWAISVPDLPGCMSDGETIEEAVHNVQDAIACWMGREVPQPVHVDARRA